MKNTKEIKPFNNCPCLDGYHCQTNSLAKIFHFYNHPLSEDMLLGLGAGMGFIYWRMGDGRQLGPKSEFGDIIFIGGRGNNKDFFQDLGKRTGVKIAVKSTTSEKKAKSVLVEKLLNEEPVMVYGDMGFLPWFDLPKEYHFGGHTFIVCGYDGKDYVLASDIDQKASGLKKGFYYPISLEQLGKARSSTYKPFPPKNTYLEFNFKNYHDPKTEDIYSAIKQTIDTQLNPPIKNIGVKGIRHTAKELLKWPTIFKAKELRMNLFSMYIFIEIGGTGGGCFRYMYSRFLEESAKITMNKKLSEASEKIYESGKLFSKIG
ncbi:MAG: hypothetical protein MSIBF_06940, partial [Candidatus Altiarchaeales archaeon IMC4]